MRLLSVLLLMWSMTAAAHTHLTASVPADNAMLMKAPEALSLTYSAEVIMLNVTVTDSKGKKVPFGFKPVTKATSEFNWTLPTLKPDPYVVNWTIVGKDGHKVQKEYSFMVH